LFGFYQAPCQVTIAEGSCPVGSCSAHGQSVLKTCSNHNRPCLTVIPNTCACVRLTCPMVEARFVAFGTSINR
jgi:hypothetical protein